ncbi:NAD(P)-binding protein [Plenodomus tracheiphilus IPT5]|uniref:NAD(P)-binding protein n=1 Tax=Plenodomus tracheiphilus IPT5 TaxID=1408161 RepID=A0A6A7AZ12_9PLEO|nr:NAD(P)-binding protein [Plenodomus tracheiphilus IPT5]
MAAQPPTLQDQTKLEDGTRESSPFNVKEKVAIVTGAGSGINLSFAALLLSRGCNVLIADLALRPEAQVLVDQYTSHPTPHSHKPNGTKQEDTKPRAVFLTTDVTNWPQLEDMFTVALKEFGGVDIVCPGAGVYDPHWSNFWHPPGAPGGASKDDPNGGRYASLDINLTHPIRTTQLAISAFLNAPQEKGKERGRTPKRVVLVSSIAGQMPNFNTPIYVAAKHAIHGFTRSLAPLDARLSIRVNAVAPGVIKTPLWTDHPEKLAHVDESKDEWATPEEVAEAMLRCLEDDELPGGTILEVGKGQTRRVEALNDPGPKGAGHTVSRIEEGWGEVFGWLGGEAWATAGERN